MATPRKAVAKGPLVTRKTAVDVEADAFLAGFDRTMREIGLRTADELEQLGENAAERIRDKAPRETGEMAESVKSEVGKDGQGPYVEVSVEPFYASFVEWGTSRRGARPFFRPGLAAALQQFPGRFERLIR